MASTVPAITCPRCEKRFKGKPELFGKRIRCPGCKKPFVVPSPDSKIDEEKLRNVIDVEEEKTAITSSAPMKFVDEDEDEGITHYDMGQYDETYRCPNCANPMESEDSVVCLYCGYNTNTRTWGRTEKTLETTVGDRVKWLLPGVLALVGMLFLTIGSLYYCLVLPNQLEEGWQWLSHESLKLWTVIISLFLMWPAGFFAYLRLIMHPSPPEKEVD